MKDLINLDKQYYMNTFGDRFPVCFTEGNGSTLISTDGKKYIDFGAGIAVNALGYNHPAMVKTISEQAAKLIHCSSLYYIGAQAKLAEILVKNSFADKAFFCNSGTEAIEGAIKLARKYFKTKDASKYHIITTTNSFHGRTIGALSATGQNKYQEPFSPLLSGFSHVPYNDLAAMQSAITNETCAIIVEPIQGEGGVIPATLDYLQGLRQLCDQHQLLLIFDEVQTGIARTGKLFAYEHYNVAPDMMALAKGLGGGIPIGALVATDEVASAFSPGSHGTTFGGNPLCCATALTVLSTIFDDHLLDQVTANGAYLMNKLNNIKENYPFIKEVRGTGLMIGMPLSDRFAVIDIVKQMLELGFLILPAGNNTLRFTPPLIITQAEIDKMINALTSVFDTLAKY